MTVIEEIAAERCRQVEVEGWTHLHDDEHGNGEMARAACSYAYEAGRTADQRNLDKSTAPPMWPWSREWWKPKSPRRDLIRAAALIVAEIERLDRAATPHEPKAPPHERPSSSSPESAQENP